MESENFITIFISFLFSLPGLFLTFEICKMNHSHDIRKLKLEKQLSDLYGLQMEILEFVDLLSKQIVSPNCKTPEEFFRLKNKIGQIIICNGSKKSIRLFTHLQEMICYAYYDGASIKNADLIALYVMLAMQVKYDTTGTKTSPEVWYRGRFTTQKFSEMGFYEDSVKKINKTVKDLKLGRFLKIKTKVK